jgi:hypothetical protein
VIRISPTITTPIRLVLLLLTMPIDNSRIADVIDRGSSLLPQWAKPKSSHNSTSTASGRDRHSGEPQGTRQLGGRSPPPTTVRADGAALRHVGRPAAWAIALATVTLPRPAPAGLLSSSVRPQPGRETQRSVRVGTAPRVAEIDTRHVGAARQAIGGVDQEE